MFGTSFGGAMQLRRKNPLVRPLEEATVGRRGVVVIVLAADVERKVDEGLATRFNEGGEPKNAGAKVS